MKIKKLNPDKIRNPEIFEYYKGNNIQKDEIFLDEYYEVDLDEKKILFSIYIPDKNENIKKEKFINSFICIRDNYLKLGRDILLDKNFWYSLFLDKLIEDLKKEYPSSLNSEKEFRNIILKKFDWENYVYKLILGAEYIQERIPNKEKHLKYFDLITQNLDLYNYILKSEIFKNSHFLIKMLDTINETKTSNILKKKINLGNGNDERIGRKVISEFVKSYPVVFVHTLDNNEFKNYFKKYLDYYNKLSK